MLRAPSRKKKRTGNEKINLTPILDAVFIFIFFLLSSFSLNLFEISTDAPIVSSSPPPKSKKKPLYLTLKIYKDTLNLYKGVPSYLIKKFGKTEEGEYDLQNFHQYLIDLKTANKDEREIIFEPMVDLKYEEIVKIMDASRIIEKLDPEFFKTMLDKEGNEFEERNFELFDKIVFGNLRG